MSTASTRMTLGLTCMERFSIQADAPTAKSVVENQLSIPNSILGNHHRPSGIRLRKKPRWYDKGGSYNSYSGLTGYSRDSRPYSMMPRQDDDDDAVVTIADESWWHRQLHSREARGLTSIVPFNKSESELDAEIIRYFWVNEDHNSWAKCRACCSICWGRERQLAHLRDGSREGYDCQTFLDKAIKLLCRDKVCVLCAKKTNNNVYGVPLCGIDCVKQWRYNDQRAAALDDALRLAGWWIHMTGVDNGNGQ